MQNESRHPQFTLATHLQQYPTATEGDDLLISADTVHGLYLHIPFCFHKCHYCDFYSIVDDRDRQAAFISRMIEEINAWHEKAADLAPQTLFVGGGTPTLLKPDLWQKLLEALHHGFDMSQMREFTIEANPETVSAELLDILVAGGVNRISIGAQSFQPDHLKTLERWHDPANVAKAARLASQAGLTNINLDLIYAIPGQTPADWQADLEMALSLDPQHLSCYALTFEPNTALTVRRDLGRISPADEEIERAMFEQTISTLTGAGFEHYEISNFARITSDPAKSYRCLHNLNYWQNHNWLAIGPSASGHLDGLRWKNIPHLGRYLASAGLPPAVDIERLDRDDAIGEQLMLGLRLIDGLPLDWIQTHVRGERLSEIERHIDTGLLERSATHLRLTAKGLLLADGIIATLI